MRFGSGTVIATVLLIAALAGCGDDDYSVGEVLDRTNLRSTKVEGFPVSDALVTLGAHCEGLIVIGESEIESETRQGKSVVTNPAGTVGIVNHSDPDISDTCGRRFEEELAALS